MTSSSPTSLRRRSISSPVIPPAFDQPQEPTQSSPPRLSKVDFPPISLASVRELRLEGVDGLDGSKVDWLVDAQSRRRVFSKTRALDEAEIVTTISVHTSSAPTPRWTIHRPRAGWYIALRPASPNHPSLESISPDGFVSLDPVASLPSLGTILGFSLRLPSSPSSSAGDKSPARKSGTPPLGKTPQGSPDVQIDINPIDSLAPPPNTSHTGPNKLASSADERIRFVLRPLQAPPRGPGLLGALKAGTAAARAVVLGDSARRTQDWACFALLREGEEQVMRWRDTAGAFATATSGTLQLAEELPALRGIDSAFWAAVALAYVEFSQDQDAYLAASSD